MPQAKNAYDYDDLIACAKGEMFGPGNPQLPMPPMLMVDRIVDINSDRGTHGKGSITAEFDIKPDLWFFGCHFIGDPVMPGCLGLDALWQMTGFYLGWIGAQGKGRALGVGELKFSGQIMPHNKLVTYQIDFKRVINRSLVMGVADGVVSVDGNPIYHASDLRVGLFKDPQ